MKLRDPKKDPMPGDIVEFARETREVIEIMPRGAVVYRVLGQERICCRKAWVGWTHGQVAPLLAPVAVPA